MPLGWGTIFRRLFLTALVAGLLAGLGISAVQSVTTTPIIILAEKYENTGPGSSLLPDDRGFTLVSPAHAHEDGQDGDSWNPGDGLERLLYTTLANVLLGIGYALILAACFALIRSPVDGSNGLLWGAAGFIVTGLAPALGLPPELPGTIAADLGARQSWWLFCAVFSAAGLWAMVFRKGTWWMLSGIALLAVPHLVGAPQPSRLGGAVPPELAAQFATASLVTAAIFWCGVGWLSGTLWRRLGDSSG